MFCFNISLALLATVSYTLYYFHHTMNVFCLRVLHKTLYMFWFVFFLIKVIYYLIKLLPSINSLSIYILPNPYGFTSTFLKKYYLNRLLWYSFLPKSQQLNTYYHKVLLNYSLFDTAWQFSTFGVILVRIFPHLDWLIPNTDTFYTV